MSRVLIIACDALAPGVIDAPEQRAWFPGIHRGFGVAGVRLECVHRGPLLSPALWGDLAGESDVGGLALGALATETSDGRLAPFCSANWRCLPPWERSHGPGSRVVSINWPGTFPVDSTEFGAQIVSDGWFLDPDAAGGISPELAGDREFRDLIIDAGSLNPGIMRLLLPGLTAHEMAADPRTQQLAESTARFYSQLNVAVTLLSDSHWREAWVRLPFLAEVASIFGRFCRLTGQAGGQTELVRRYEGVLSNAHRLADSALAQIVGAAGHNTYIGLFGGWRRRGGSGAGTGPLGVLHERGGRGVFMAAGPGIGPGDKPPDSAEQCVAWLRTRSGVDNTARSKGAMPIRPQPAIPETIRRGLLKLLVADGSLRERDIDTPGAGRYWSRATDWFNAVRVMEEGDFEAALPQLLNIWEGAPEVSAMTQVVARALAAVEDASAARKVIEMLGDDGIGDPASLAARARLALATGDIKEAGRLAASLPAADPSLAACRLRAELSLHRGDVAEAFQVFGEIIAGEPRDAGAWIGLVRCYLADHSYSDAMAAVRHAERLLPGNLALLLLGAEVAEMGGDRLNASARLDQAIRRAPASQMVAQVASLLGRTQASQLAPVPPLGIKYFEKVSESSIEWAGDAVRFRFGWLPEAWLLEQEARAMVWFAGNPRRIAGFASWEVIGENVRLNLLVRHRWREDQTGLTEFLRKLVEAIREESSAGTIYLTVGENLAALPAIDAAGFTRQGLDQMRVSFDYFLALPVLDSRAAKLSETTDELSHWTVRDASAADVPWLRSLWCRPGLLTEAQFQNALETWPSWIVLIAERSGVPIGAVLLRQSDLEVMFYIENALAIRRKDWLAFKLVIYRATLRRIIPLGIIAIRCTTNPATNRRIMNFVESIGGAVVSEAHHFVLAPAV